MLGCTKKKKKKHKQPQNKILPQGYLKPDRYWFEISSAWSQGTDKHLLKVPHSFHVLFVNVIFKREHSHHFESWKENYKCV